MEEEVKIKITGDESGAIKAIGNVDKKLDGLHTKAEQSGGILSGVFGKIGVAIAGAFALDKVIDFFKSAVAEAKKAEKAAGKIGSGAADGFKKAEEDIDSSIKKLKDLIGPTLLKIVRFFYDAAAAVLGGIAKVADAMADAFTIKNADKVAASYQKVKKELLDMGAEIDKLNKTNNKTAEQELELIKLKDQLGDKAKNLVLTIMISPRTRKII